MYTSAAYPTCIWWRMHPITLVLLLLLLLLLPFYGHY